MGRPLPLEYLSTLRVSPPLGWWLSSRLDALLRRRLR